MARVGCSAEIVVDLLAGDPISLHPWRTGSAGNTATARMLLTVSFVVAGIGVLKGAEVRVVKNLLTVDAVPCHARRTVGTYELLAQWEAADSVITGI